MFKSLCNIRSLLYPVLLFPVMLYAQESDNTCYLEFVKADCWNDYKVELKLIDASNLKEQQHFNLSMNTQSIKVPFPCSANQQIAFKASFNPPIWDNQIDTWYQGNKIYNVPSDIDSDQSIWTVNVCFATDFTRVSLPPQSSRGSCSCQFGA